ncbi:hypothetical protein [Jannaschia marina]|uniref:hypothetical protein n=1 Tax=Jannaschia marina TaxID=2741674 RepID=UPI0015CB9277|nr:hypothetical protein [Jannaschia marina]
MTLTLRPNDGRIHVFSVSDGPVRLAHQTYLSQLSDEGDATPLLEALGAEIDPTYVEVFAVQDVEPMGLRTYLAQAHDIPDETLAADAARLDALSGDVLVLAPLAVEGVAELKPVAELTHIGSYAPAEADNTPVDLPPAVKDPGQAAPAAPATGVLSRGAIIAIVVVAILLAAALLLLWAL